MCIVLTLAKRATGHPSNRFGKAFKFFWSTEGKEQNYIKTYATLVIISENVFPFLNYFLKFLNIDIIKFLWLLMQINF